jgi:hypothetical protein
MIQSCVPTHFLIGLTLAIHEYVNLTESSKQNRFLSLTQIPLAPQCG